MIDASTHRCLRPAAAIAVGLVALVGAVSCSTSGESAGGNPPTTVASADVAATNPAPSTTADIDYAAQYLAIVAPSNCAIKIYNDASDRVFADPDAPPDVLWARIEAEMLPALRALAEADVKFYEALAAAEWPPDVQPDIDALVAETAEAAQRNFAASQAESLEELAAQPDLPTTNAAGVVRAKLGLPSNVTDDADDCAEAPAT